MLKMLRRYVSYVNNICVIKPFLRIIYKYRFVWGTKPPKSDLYSATKKM